MPEPFRTLHVIDTGGPGGAETMFAQLVAGWPGGSECVDAVVSRDGWLLAELHRRNATAAVLDPQGSLNVRYLAKLVGRIRRHRPAVVLAHLFGSCLYAGLAGRLCGVPVVGILHGQSDIGDGRLAGLKNGLLRRILARLVCVSEELADDIAGRLDFDRARLRVIRNGIDTRTFAPAESAGNPATDATGDFVVGAVGNIRRPKSYDVLLRAARQVIDRQPDIRFRIVGEGSDPLLADLLALRAELGLDDHVAFDGFQMVDAGLYSDFDLYVSSSTTEGFSLTCVEAMACARPVVATRSGGPQGIIDDGSTGLLVDVQAPDQLATAILQLYDDPQLRRQLGNAARRSAVDRYSIDATLAAYVDLCDEIRRPIR